MAFSLVVLPAARADLIEIGDYIVGDDPARAATFVAEIEARIRQTAERPFSFPARPDLHEDLRQARHGRYAIFFTVEETAEGAGEVRIVRVLHGARNLGHVLRD